MNSGTAFSKVSPPSRPIDLRTPAMLTAANTARDREQDRRSGHALVGAGHQRAHKR